MASPAGAQLLLRVNEKFLEFLRTQTPAQLQAIADGRLVLTATSPQAGVQTATDSSRRTDATSKVDSERSNASALNPDEIAAHLRGLNSVEEGEAYLAGFKRSLTVSILEKVAAALGVSGKGKLRPELIRLVLRQALGARGKYAGLHAG